MNGGAWALLGFAVGTALSALAAWQVQRRSLLKVRLAERRARSAERMAEIGAMTGGLAHEIKNPLSTIGLNAQLLHEAISESDLPGEERSRMLSRTTALRRETERLGGILTDFLEYAGQVHLDRTEADLNALVQEIADFFLPEAERHGVRLRIEASSGGGVGAAGAAGGGTLVLRIDVKRIKQALLNLMLNATQAMYGAYAAGSVRGPEGSARPEAGRIPAGAAGELILRTETGKDSDGRRVARLHVIDTGPGIPPDTLAKIFNPYFTTRAGGSGLGLSTSRRLVQEHGGRIDVVSEPGRGSDFVVVLPIDETER